VDPEEWWAVTEKLPYAVGLDWSASRADGSYDVLLEPRVHGRASASGGTILSWPCGPGAIKPWSEYVNDPLNGALARDLLPNLRAFLEARLPEYMVPGGFLFLDALPRMPNGKVNRQALPPPDAVRPRTEGAYVAPRTAVEEKLAALWAQVLGLRQVGLMDNFFIELGGHSLLATRLVVRVRETFPVDLPLRRLFEAPTVESLAKVIEEALRGSTAPRPAPILRLPRTPYRPPEPKAGN
jgi:acyl carrier protein